MTEDRPVAVVTGAAGGIGSELAHFFARDGYAVVVADLRADAAEQTAGGIREEGHAAIGVPVDVTDETSTLAMARAVDDEFGRVDVLVNNAGLFGDRVWTGPVLEIDTESWDALMAVNVKGTLLCSRAVAPVMRKAAWGRIVNISSMGAYLPAGGYSLSKLAVHHLTWTLALELGPDNITVNCIGPGTIDGETCRRQNSPEQIEARIASSIVKRLGRPSDIYAAIRYFASTESEFCTGQVLLVNGGVNVRL